MVRVGIVDDHAIVRAGLKELLAEYADLQVVGEASNGREAKVLVRTVPVDVLVMDIFMPGQSALDALAGIRAQAPNIGVVIFSGMPEGQYAMNLIRLGASGYLNKDCDPKEIIKAIRAVSLGRKYITPVVADLLAEQLNPQNIAPHQTLNEREFQVFLKLASGEHLLDVAEDLSLSAKTVSTYRSRLLSKLALASNSDLTYYALKHKLIN